MMANTWIWVSYLSAALLVLLYKWGRYVYFAALDESKPVHEATMEWFFEASVANGVSWVVTIGVVWVFGAMYINQVTWSWFSWIREVPVHAAIAFLFGALMEMIAPAVVKLIVSKIPFANIPNGGE
jgi:hypothetical protein